MSKRLNTVDDMKMDNLIYDHFKIIDAKVVPVTVSDGPGTLRRGQLLDFDAEDVCSACKRRNSQLYRM